MSDNGVYLLLGPESGLKQEFIDTLREQIRKQTGEKPEEHRIYPFKTELRDVLSLLRNGSLFSTHRFVLFHDAQEIRKKADAELLAEYCRTPSPDVTLLLISDGFQVDRRIDKEISKERRKIFWELFENQKRSWIQDYFRKKGFSITGDAVELLLSLVENDTQDLKRESDRLISFFDNGARIDEEAVARLIYHSKEENVFTLFERVAARDFQGALSVYQAIRLSGQGEPVALMGGLLWQFRNLLAYRRLVDKNYSPDDAFSRINVRAKRSRQTYLVGAEHFSAPDIEQIIVLAAEFEDLFRSIRSEMLQICMELFLYYGIVQRGRRDRSDVREAHA